MDFGGKWAHTTFRTQLNSFTGAAQGLLRNIIRKLISSLGLISVVKTGREFNLIHSYDLEEPVFVTPAIDASTMYIRTEKSLMALRSKNK